MSKALYDEAIAEAKLLRETAEQNAKNAIIEAVTPRIRNFIEEQLLSQGNRSSDPDESVLEESIRDILGDENNEAVELDESALSALVNLLGVDLVSESYPRDGTNISDAFHKAFGQLSDSEKHSLKSIAKNLSENQKSLKNSDINTIKQENSTMAPTSGETFYEIDLDMLSEELGSILEDGGKDSEKITPTGEAQMSSEDRELEELMKHLLDDNSLNEARLEIDLGEDVELPEDIRPTVMVLPDEEEEEEDLDLDLDLDVEDELVGEEDFDLDLDVEEESLDEVFEIDEKVLRNELRRLRQKISEGKALTDIKGIKNDMADNWGGSGSSSVGIKHVFGGKGQGKIDAFGGGKRGGDALTVKLNMLKERYENERRSNRSLKTKLVEYRSAVETLREQLTDLNLFNAKLLYVNKLLGNKEISMSQRNSIVKSLDTAKSLREVKLLYRSLTHSLSPRKNVKLNESAARRVLGSSSRKTGKSSSSDSGMAEVNRWAKLAGLKNN